MLSIDDFNYLLDKQALLDTNIRNAKQISYAEWMGDDMETKHSIALKVEVAEFVNECHDVWKYWKDKMPKLNNILDEAVDVIHFVLLIVNKREVTGKAKLLYLDIEQYTDNARKIDSHKLLEHMLVSPNIADNLAVLFVILDRYGFTREDILDQYHTKNRENFRRLKSGY